MSPPPWRTSRCSVPHLPQPSGSSPLAAYASRRLSIAGVEAVAVGNDDFGVPAIDLFVPSGSLPAIVATLTAAGVSSVDDDLGDVLRIEAGTPAFGVDMTHETIPLEAGIEDRAISLTKGCYVGQEVIIRVLHRGQGRVARRLVGLTFPADGQPPPRGERLHAGERQIRIRDQRHVVSRGRASCGARLRAPRFRRTRHRG